MKSDQLFIALIHRLKSYPDAMVLHAVLRQEADVEVYKSSSGQIATNLLGGLVQKKQVQRSLLRLAESGFLEIKVHSQYKTHVTVDREAVQALLRLPVSDYVPGVIEDTFRFLDELKAEAEAEAEAKQVAAIKRASDLHKPDQPDAS